MTMRSPAARSVIVSPLRPAAWPRKVSPSAPPVSVSDPPLPSNVSAPIPPDRVSRGATSQRVAAGIAIDSPADAAVAAVIEIVARSQAQRSGNRSGVGDCVIYIRQGNAAVDRPAGRLLRVVADVELRIATVEPVTVPLLLMVVAPVPVEAIPRSPPDSVRPAPTVTLFAPLLDTSTASSTPALRWHIDVDRNRARRRHGMNAVECAAIDRRRL